MARLKHKPGHYKADKNGWVTEDDWKEWPYIGSIPEDMGYIDGNTKVSVHYIPDEMAPTRHMANGRMYTSKHKFRQETKARGCVEVGDQTHVILQKRKPIELDRRQRADDIRRAIYELRNGRNIRDN